MSTTGPGRRRVRPAVDEQPLRGGFIGIALVALATLGLAVAAAVLVGIIFLVV